MNQNENKKQRACELAKELLANDVDYLDRIIEMWKIGSRLHGQAWNTELHVFGVIASDTDHLPTKNMRPLCTEGWQAESDREIGERTEFYRKQVTEACTEILAKYGSAYQRTSSPPQALEGRSQARASVRDAMLKAEPREAKWTNS